jgi:DNA-binding MarR family transcriptional regulator
MSYANHMSRLTAADAALSSELRFAVMRLSRRLRAERTDTSLSVSQMAVLATLERVGPLSPGELAVRERVQPPSMTRTVALLEAKGFVARAAHPKDGRQVVVALTQPGRALLSADRRRRDAWLSCRLAELSVEDLAQLRCAVPLLAGLADA